MGKGKEIQQRRRARARQQQIVIISVVAVAALALIGFSIYINRPQPAGEIVKITKTAYPFVEGKTMGAAEATVVIQEFADFQCPFCGKFSQTVEKQLIDEFIATGQARLEYHHFIVVDRNVGGQESRRAAQASECAAEQGDFWNYHALVFANQKGEGDGAFSDVRLKAFAAELGLDTGKFNTCFDVGRYANAVMADEQLARSLNVSRTPTLFVNGREVENPLDYSEFQRIITAALAGAN